MLVVSVCSPDQVFELGIGAAVAAREGLRLDGVGSRIGEIMATAGENRIVIVDGESNTTPVVDALRARSGPAPALVVVSRVFDPDCVVEWVRAGVRGLIGTDRVTEDLVPAVHAVAGGGAFLDGRAMGLLVAAVQPPAKVVSDRWNQLSPRQAQVLESLLAGRNNREIASRLFISERTVKYHVSELFRVFGVTSRNQLISIGHRERFGDRAGAS